MKTKLEVKSVKHVFSLEERDEVGGMLARALATLRGINAEFDEVKASYKFKIAEAEAAIGSLETKRTNGFEWRQENCRVVYRAADRKKDYYLEHSPDDPKYFPPVLTENMTTEDFQAELELKQQEKEENELL
jgi:hypothetical protein